MARWLTAAEVLERRARRDRETRERAVRRAETRRAREVAEVSPAPAEKPPRAKREPSPAARYARKVERAKTKSLPGAPRVDRRSTAWRRYEEIFHGINQTKP